MFLRKAVAYFCRKSGLKGYVSSCMTMVLRMRLYSPFPTVDFMIRSRARDIGIMA